MSISDDLMARYYDLLLARIPPGDLHPLEAKKQLAFEIVQTYHSPAAAQKTLDEWNTRFSKRDLGDADLPAFSAIPGADSRRGRSFRPFIGTYSTVQKSHSELSRLIKQGSVEIDGTKIRDPKATVTLKRGSDSSPG